MHLTLFVPLVCLFFFVFFNMLTNDLILAQGGLMTTVGGAAPKTGTNDVSGGHRWCSNLSTSFFFFMFL
jgi:hypothetical protein